MRRIARLLADLFARYGFEAMVDARLTSRSRTAYVVPLAARRDGALVLVDGDPSATVLDEVEVHRLVMAATDLGCRTALYVHAGALTPQAIEAAQDRVHFWSRHDIVPLLGEAQWAHAMGEPLPPLPAPFGNAPPVPQTPTQATAPVVPDGPAEPLILDLEATEMPEPAPVFRPEADEVRPTITLAESDTLQEEAFLDLGGADLGDELATPDDGVLPEPVPEPVVAPIEPVTTYDLPPTPPVEASLPVVESPTPAAIEQMPAAFQHFVSTAVAEAPPAPPTPPAPPEPLFVLPQAFREPEPEAAKGPAIATPDGSRGLLPPRVTLKEAKAQVADRLFDIEEAELILQPVHLFDYAVELLRGGSLNVDTVSGRLQVNGTDRRVLPTDPGASDPNLAHRVFATPDLTLMDKVCRVSPERAKQVAAEWATAQHAKTVEVNGAGADDSFDLVEKRQVGPTSGQVHLTYLGLWHRPFWRLWGNNGHIDLDAVEGLVLDSEIKGPSADVMLVE